MGRVFPTRNSIGQQPDPDSCYTVNLCAYRGRSANPGVSSKSSPMTPAPSGTTTDARLHAGDRLTRRERKAGRHGWATKQCRTVCSNRPNLLPHDTRNVWKKFPQSSRGALRPMVREIEMSAAQNASNRFVGRGPDLAPR